MEQQIALGFQRQQTLTTSPHIDQQAMSSLIFGRPSSLRITQILCLRHSPSLATLWEAAEVGTSWRKIVVYLEWCIRGCSLPWRGELGERRVAFLLSPCVFSFSPHHLLVEACAYRVHITELTYAVPVSTQASCLLFMLQQVDNRTPRNLRCREVSKVAQSYKTWVVVLGFECRMSDSKSSVLSLMLYSLWE